MKIQIGLNNMADFQGRIKTLDADIRDLNTNGLRSSSSLGVAEREIDVTMQIVGYKVSSDNDNCASKQAALIELRPEDGKSMLTNAALISGGDQLTNRGVVLIPTTINDNPGYEFRIQKGSPADLSTIQGGGSIPAITFRFLLTATSEFNVNLTYRTDH